MGASNGQLRAAVRAYAAAALGALDRRVRAGARVPAVAEGYWDRQPETDDFLRQGRRAPLWQHLYGEALGELSALPEYRACAEAIGRDPTIAAQLGVPVGMPTGWRAPYTPENLMAAVVLGMLRRQGRPHYDEGHFEREYEAMWRAFSEDWAPAELVAPITGLGAATDRIELGKGLAITPLSDEERALYVDFGEFVTDGIASGVPRFAVRRALRAQKLVGEPTPELSGPQRALAEEVRRFDAQLGDLDLALRAFKPGRYELRRGRLRIESWFPTNSGSSSGVLLHGVGYTLDAVEAEELAGFWRKVQGAGLGEPRAGSEATTGWWTWR